MVVPSDQHKIKLTGPGLSFERPVSKEVANQIINLVMTGEATLPPSQAASDAGREALGTLTPKQFIAQKRPSTDYERAACLGYYLTHNRGLLEFKTADISKIGTEAALNLSNPALAVQHATNTYRYLAKAGGGKKQITVLGEAVVEALPNREKVKAANAEHKPKRRKRRRKKTQ